MTAWRVRGVSAIACLLTACASAGSALVHERARAPRVAASTACSPPPHGAGVAPVPLVQSRHAARVTTLSFSPDGHLLATASEDGSAKVWDVRSGALLRTEHASFAAPSVATFRHDGRAFVFGGGQPVGAPVWVLDLDTGAALATASGSGDVQHVRFLRPVPSRGAVRWIGETDADKVVFFDADLHATGFIGHSFPDTVVSIAPDELRVGITRTGSPAQVRLYDGDKPSPDPAPTTAVEPHALLLLPARAGVVVGGPSGAEVITADGRHTRLQGLDGVLDLALLPDSQRVVAAAGGVLGVWRLRDGSRLWSTTSDERSFFAGFEHIAVARDGRIAAGITTGRVLLFAPSADGYGFERELGYGIAQQVTDVQFLDDDTVLAASPGRLSGWSLSDGRFLGVRDDGALIGAVASPPSGYTVARAYAPNQCPEHFAIGFQRWPSPDVPSAPEVPGPAVVDAPSGKAVHLARATLLGTTTHLVCTGAQVGLGVSMTLTSQAFAAGWVVEDAQRLPTGKPIALKNFLTGQRVALASPADSFIPYWPLRITADGKHVYGTGLSSTTGQTAVVWDLGSGAALRSFPNVTRIALEPDGKRAAIAAGVEVAVVRTTGTDPIVPLRTASIVTSLAFDLHGDVLVGAGDGSLARLHDGMLSACGSFEGGALRGIWPHPHRDRAIVLDADGDLVVWDTAQGRPLARFVEFEDGDAVAITHDGYMSGSVDALGRIGWQFDAPLEVQLLSQYDRTAYRPEAVADSLRGSACSPPPPALPRAPRVTVVQPPPREGTSLDVQVTVKVEGAPDTVVRAYVEGLLAGEGSSHGTGLLQVPIHLRPGRNRVSLIAFAPSGFSSLPATLDVTAPRASAARSKLWVVAVGASRYPKLPAASQLRVAADDARSLADYLARQAGPDRSYASIDETLLTDDEVTPPAIAAALDKLATMAPEDLAVVLLAGHGMATPEGPMVFVTPASDGSDAANRSFAVHWSDLAQRLARAPGHVLVLLDACHSGGMSDDLVVPNGELAQELVRGRRGGTIVFAASEGRQLSHEGAWNGLFTGALLESLDDPQTDGDGDGWLEIGEIVQSVVRRVERDSHGQQTPWLMREELFGGLRIVKAAARSPFSPAR